MHSCRRRRARTSSCGLGSLLAVALLVVALLPGSAEARRRTRSKVKRGPPPVAALTKDGGPNVQASAAIVVDLDSGDLLYAKRPDDSVPIASTGKLVLALTVRRKGVVLAAKTVITATDRLLARGGAKSRLLEGRAFSNHDLLHAMLMGSDNRACTAVGRGAGLEPERLIAEMNETARGLGLRRTRFTDPSGLHGNTSTAREMITVLQAALADPVIARILGTVTHTVVSADAKRVQVTYTNTNHLLRTRRDCIGGKTGFTDEALYCLVAAGHHGGRRVGMVFLGAQGELTRFADYSRVASWLEQGGPERPPTLPGK